MLFLLIIFWSYTISFDPFCHSWSHVFGLNMFIPKGIINRQYKNVGATGQAAAWIPVFQKKRCLKSLVFKNLKKKKIKIGLKIDSISANSFENIKQDGQKWRNLCHFFVKVYFNRNWSFFFCLFFVLLFFSFACLCNLRRRHQFMA